MAAEKRYDVAQTTLGILYEKGEGTERDLIKVFIGLGRQQETIMHVH